MITKKLENDEKDQEEKQKNLKEQQRIKFEKKEGKLNNKRK